jgi:hypothetical protein
MGYQAQQLLLAELRSLEQMNKHYLQLSQVPLLMVV